MKGATYIKFDLICFGNAMCFMCNGTVPVLEEENHLQVPLLDVTWRTVVVMYVSALTW